jgi:hypothetical protein
VARIRPSFDVALSGTTAGTQGHLLLVRLVSRVSEEEVAASLPPPLPLAQALEALKQQVRRSAALRRRDSGSCNGAPTAPRQGAHPDRGHCRM